MLYGLYGFFMLTGSGLGWAFTGILMSYTARKGVRVTALLAPQMILGLTAALIIMPDYQAMRSDGLTDLWPLGGLLTVAGVINGVGILILQRAMRAGHNGVAWAIGQSALILPFLAGTFLFGEPITIIRLLGLSAILASLMAFGLAKDNPQTPPKNTLSGGPRHSFLLALAALFILGTAQTLITLPSHVPGLTDGAGMRVPWLYFGMAMVYTAVWSRRPVMPEGRILVLALINSVVGISSTLLLFGGLDRLAQVKMASLGFPVAIGTCILGFAIYSILWLRESCTSWHIGGILTGLFGVLCIALSG